MADCKPLVIGCASNDGYVRYAAAMLLSAVCNTPHRKIRIHYLHGPDLTSANREKLESVLNPYAPRVTLHWQEIPDEWVMDLPLFKTMKPGSLRPVMWYRLFLPQLLAQEDRILYLDCDVTVLQDLGPLWDTSLEGMALAAVTNPFNPRDIDGQALPQRLGLPGMEAYFNSGVMLLDLNYFRRHGVAERVLEHGRQHSELVRFGDQDSLCAILHAQRLRLPPKWNLLRLIIFSAFRHQLFDAADLHSAIREPAIVHYEGGVKPWINPTHHPYGRSYLKYARQLPWPVIDAPKSLDDLENLLIRHDWLRALKRFRVVRRHLSPKPRPADSERKS